MSLEISKCGELVISKSKKKQTLIWFKDVVL